MNVVKVLLASLLVFSLVGCGASPTKEESPKKVESVTKAFPVTIKDALGKEVTIKSEPKRIVSLMPSNTETVFAVGKGKSVVGITDFDNYPAEETKDIKKIGGMEVNAEVVLGLNPDLVLAHESGATAEAALYKKLEDAGIPVINIPNATSFADTYEGIKMIGKTLGVTKNADDIVAAMKDKVEAIKNKVAKNTGASPKVWVEVSPLPDLYTTGKGTFLDEMLTIVNATNIAKDQTGWVKLSEEFPVKNNPDVVLITYGDYTPNAKETLMKRPGWENVAAVKEKKVFDVNSDLVTRSGPRLVDGLEEVAKVLYPELMK